MQQQETQQTEQIGGKKKIAHTAKATVPGVDETYSHLNTVYLTNNEYSSLEHNTTGAQGEGPPAAVIPGNGNLDHVAHDRK